MKVYGLGRLTKDIELKDAGSTKVANFSLAVNRRIKREGQPEVDFFNCTVFGKRAETMAQYLKKGSLVYVEGTLQNDTYQDKDGKNVTRTSVIVDTFEFTGSNPAGASDGDPIDADDSIPFN